MSKTAILWLMIYFPSCLASLANPTIGYATYLFAYYTNPRIHWWGNELAWLRYSLIAALAMLVSYVINRAGRHSLGFFAQPQSKWLLMLVVLSYIVTPFAVSPEESIVYAVKLTKTLVLFYLMSNMISKPSIFRIIVVANILGGMYWFVEAVIDPKMIDGRLVNIGGPDTDTGNSTASHIGTLLPLVGFAWLAGKRWEKGLALIAAPTLLWTFELLNSRGALVGVAVAGLFALRWGWKRWRNKLLIAFLLGGIGLAYVAGEKFLERQKTTWQPEDHSALSRLTFWKGALRLMRDHPLGAGGKGFDLLSYHYIPEELERKGATMITVHNTYLLCGSEWGPLGLSFFLMFLICTLRQLNDLRARPPTTDVQWRVQADAIAVQVALISILVAGMFGNRLYGEVIYWLCAYSAGLNNIWARDVRETASETVPVEQEPVDDPPSSLTPSPAHAGGHG